MTDRHEQHAKVPSGEVPDHDEVTFAVMEGAVSATDVDQIVDLVQSAYRGEASRQGWTTEADLLEGQRVDAEMIRELLEGEDSVIVVAQRTAVPGTDGRPGELIGCCELRYLDSEGSAYLGMFAISPRLQAAGLGRRFLEEAAQIARRLWNARRLSITVIDAREELIAWYERRGFVRTGETSEFPYGDERFGRPLRSDLKFEALTKEIN